MRKSIKSHSALKILLLASCLTLFVGCDEKEDELTAEEQALLDKVKANAAKDGTTGANGVDSEIENEEIQSVNGENINILDIPGEIEISDLEVLYYYKNAVHGSDTQANAGFFGEENEIQPYNLLNIFVDDSALFLNYANEHVWKVKPDAVTRNKAPLSGPSAEEGIELYGVQLDESSTFSENPKVVGLESQHIFLSDGSKIVIVKLDGKDGFVKYAPLPDNDRVLYAGSIPNNTGYFVVLDDAIVSFKMIENGEMQALGEAVAFEAQDLEASLYQCSVYLNEGAVALQGPCSYLKEEVLNTNL